MVPPGGAVLLPVWAPLQLQTPPCRATARDASAHLASVPTRSPPTRLGFLSGGHRHQLRPRDDSQQWKEATCGFRVTGDSCWKKSNQAH